MLTKAPNPAEKEGSRAALRLRPPSEGEAGGAGVKPCCAAPREWRAPGQRRRLGVPCALIRQPVRSLPSGESVTWRFGA